MMSDHWKLLANILGTPGPAEPAAKEPAKKKFDVSSEENKSNVASPAGNPVVRDPLAEIVIRQPEPVVPGFDIPAPAPIVEKPAKRSAWDTLIGTLGIKSASEPEPEVEAAPPRATTPTVAPSRSEAAPTSRGFASELQEQPRPSDTRPAKRGFGAGLVDSADADALSSDPIPDFGSIPDPAPPRASSFRDPEPRESRGPREPRETREPRPRRDSGGDDTRSTEPRSFESRSSEPRRPESRSAEPRSNEPAARDPRPSNARRRDEPREGSTPSRDSRGNDRGREPRSRDSRSQEPRTSSPQRNEPKSDVPQKSRGFGAGLGDNDGILDWDVDEDDVFLRDDDLLDDDIEADASEPVADSDRAPAGTQDRDDDRPRGRGRRGGSRNRGRGDFRSDEKVETSSGGDEIGWNDDVVADDVTPARHQAPARSDASRDAAPRRDDGRDSSRGGRGREPRRDSASAPRDSGRDSGTRDSVPRGEGRRDSVRDEPRRETSARDDQRREPVREESRRDDSRRDAPAREVARRTDRTEETPAAEGSRRAGRRGQRQQMSGELPSGNPNPRVSREEIPRLPDVDLDYDDLMSEALPSPIADTESADSAEGPSRPRRRRGRRGRGGSSNASAPSDRDSIDRIPTARDEIGFEDVGFAAELSPDAIDAVELNDDLDSDVEAERVQRGRRRGRGRGASRERSDSPVVADSSTERSSADDAVSKNRGVPTWLDTVNLLVDPNIERHRRSGPPRPTQGRGNRR